MQHSNYTFHLYGALYMVAVRTLSLAEPNWTPVIIKNPASKKNDRDSQTKMYLPTETEAIPQHANSSSIPLRADSTRKDVKTGNRPWQGLFNRNMQGHSPCISDSDTPLQGASSTSKHVEGEGLKLVASNIRRLHLAKIRLQEC
jgi:hypothetical protein